MTNVSTRLSKYLFLYIGLFFISLLSFIPSVEATPPDFNGGVLNEYTYEEYFFLTPGVPIKFSGKAIVTEREQNNKLTKTYRFTLSNPNGSKLTRSVVYESALDKRLDKGQTTSQTIVKSYSEKVTVGKDSYTLDDYQFSQGAVADNRPASDYYSGNTVGRKIYKTNTNDLITVQFSGRNMGYENFWGASETQIIDYEVTSKLGKALITSKVSDSKNKFLKYEPNDPVLSSFTGGHALISQQNMIAEYTYDIPYGPKKGTLNLTQDMVPTIDRLIVPKFRDLTKHWAKDDIERLYSLGVFDEASQFFSPGTPMNRYDFTVGVLKAADIRVLEQPKNQRAPKKALFSDLDTSDPDYLYIESAFQKGVIKGGSGNKFMPKSSLTRAQAVTILVRALGFEGRAPAPGYQTKYADNSSLPNWAKDSVYVATEIGLVTGDGNNRFNPNKNMTRAEASTLIIRFLNFLEEDLKQNYRDDILFLNN